MMEQAIGEGGVARRTVDGGRGVAWWSESWALFMKNPGIWVVFGLVVLVGLTVLSLIPLIGGLAACVLLEVIIGGWVLSARKLDTGGALELGDLFSGFKDKLNPLLVLGAIAAVAGLVIAMVAALMGGGAIVGMATGAAYKSAGGLMAGAAFGLLAALVGLALAFVFSMAMWFAAALVVFRGSAPVDAMKTSWAASLANFVPFLVYGLIWIVAAVVASIPFLLGWLLLMPLTMLGIYCSYKDIFEASDALAPGQQ
jgi:uncharacterized membrane protein